MGVYELALKRRTVRKFRQDPISSEELVKMVNAARFAPSASNLQPVKYKLVNTKFDVEQIFQYVKWAAYIAPEGNPGKGEEPVAYIILLADTEIRKNGYEEDIGAAAQSIFLTALEDGIGTCWMGAIDKNKIREYLKIPERYIIDTLIALGYPAENPEAEEESGSIRYYKDGKGTLHVPKRKLEDIIL